MAETERRTGGVTSRRGRIKAARINTGLTMESAADIEVVRAATEALGRLSTGDVSAARGVYSAGEINVGIRIDTAADAGAAGIAPQLVALRDLLRSAAAEDSPPEVGLAAWLTDRIIGSMEPGHQDKDLPITGQIRELVTLLSRAGLTVETASECASAVSAALKLALGIFGMIH